MEKFQNNYRIQSTRMREWDYSNGGRYYVTICIRKRICCFGDIVNGEMILNEMGRIANDFWLEIPLHLPNTWLDAHIVMPNHIHGIIVMKRLHVKNAKLGNGRDLGNVCVFGNVETLHATSLLHTEEHTNEPDISGNARPIRTKGTFMSNISPKPGSLNVIIRSFKSACTKKFNELGHGGWFDWQPRFYDRIIRNDTELHRIRQYIINNPSNWTNDEHNRGYHNHKNIS